MSTIAVLGLYFRCLIKCPLLGESFNRGSTVHVCMIQLHVWSAICVVSYMCGWLHVWSATCVVSYMCGWLHVWSATCVVSYMCGWLHVWLATCVFCYMCDWLHV